MQRSSYTVRTLGILTAIILVGPTLVIIPLGFTDRNSFQFPPKGWSLNYYERLFTDPVWASSFLNSFLLGISVATIAVIAGTLAALGLQRVTGKFAGLLRSVFLLPLVIPGIVAAVAIYKTYLMFGADGTWFGFIAAHTAIALPIVIVTVGASLSDVGQNQKLASQSLGAGSLATFFQVILPQIKGGIMGGAIFAFVTSFDEVVVSLFIQSPKLRTLPVQMYASVTTEADPTIAAAATVVLVLTTLLIVVVFGLGKVRTPYE